MTELETARKVIGIAGEICRGVDTTRNEILKMAGRARVKELKRDLDERVRSGPLVHLPGKERDLHLEIISSLDQMARRMPHPLPKAETDRVQELINELDRVRTSKERLPLSPGLCIWRGELQLRCHNYSQASKSFADAVNILENLIDDGPDVPPTLVTAFTESAYSLAMLNEEQEAYRACEKAINIARKGRGDEQFWTKLLREFFVAGDLVTRPLAAAYFAACDVRVNLDGEWDPSSRRASDFTVYWNLLNDECDGLSALQIPHLIAVLSDENWINKRPDLSAPIARSLYIMTSTNIPHQLWRRANLFVGGFRYSETVSKAAQSSAKAASVLIVVGLVGLNGPPGIASSQDELRRLSPAAIAEFYDVDTERFPVSDVPSGAEIIQSLNQPSGQEIDAAAMAAELQEEVRRESESTNSQDHATAGASLVSSRLV